MRLRELFGSPQKPEPAPAPPVPSAPVVKRGDGEKVDPGELQVVPGNGEWFVRDADSGHATTFSSRTDAIHAALDRRVHHRVVLINPDGTVYGEIHHATS